MGQRLAKPCKPLDINQKELALRLLHEHTSKKGRVFMKDNEEIIRDFITAWSRLDAEELASYFTDDGIYHNMPTDPVAGRAAVQAFIAGFAKDWTETNWDIINLIAKDDIVMVERLDRTKLGDKSVDLPCFGIFEMENGKIKIWRDYFDIGTYMNALA